MEKTQEAYLRRIHLVLDFIENHLETDLSLELIAAQAHYSPFHFHRVFSTVVGERLNAYITRKRIERIASILLVEPEAPIGDLAYRYGFNSDSAFSRAFKKYYGISPTAFKMEGKALLSKIGIEPFSTEKYLCSIDHLKQWNPMNAEIAIAQLPELKLATLSDIGAFDKIGAMLQRLMEWGHQQGVLDMENFKALTLYHDNPHVTESAKVRFSTGVSIKANITTECTIKQTSIRSGTYAVGHVEISAEEIPTAWKSVTLWVIENGYQFREGDYVEVYLNDHNTHPEQKFILDICMPIETPAKLSSTAQPRQTAEGKKAPPSGNPQPLSYHQLMDYMKELKRYLQHQYDATFTFGNIYKGSPDYSYFSLTTEALKKLKLKFVIILDHKQLAFSICLSGQNKSIRKKYWRMFKDSTWDNYHIAESIDDSLMIIDHTLVEAPDFGAREELSEEIEREAVGFMEEMRGILEG